MLIFEFFMDICCIILWIFISILFLPLYIGAGIFAWAEELYNSCIKEVQDSYKQYRRQQSDRR